MTQAAGGTGYRCSLTYLFGLALIYVFFELPKSRFRWLLNLLGRVPVVTLEDPENLGRSKDTVSGSPAYT